MPARAKALGGKPADLSELPHLRIMAGFIAATRRLHRGYPRSAPHWKTAHLLD